MASGRFVLRMPAGLHEALREEAARADVSLNEWCVRRLAQTAADADGRAALVQRALSQFGSRLLGVVAFGSWARGGATAHSDVDVLVVVDPGIAITRQLYRDWDEATIRLDGLEVEVHIAALPAPRAELSSFWAEVALDGVILYQRELTVSRALSAVRRRLLDQELVRRRAGDNVYWTASRDHAQR